MMIYIPTGNIKILVYRRAPNDFTHKLIKILPKSKVYLEPENSSSGP
jgi:hypothetical protein